MPEGLKNAIDSAKDKPKGEDTVNIPAKTV